jgi:thymidine kinase
MSLELITGPMFSGKTLELICRLEHAATAGHSVRAAKPSIDLDRGWLVSTAGRRLPAKAIDGRDAIVSLAAEGDVIGIDEVQFLSPRELDGLECVAAEGSRVIAAGLDLDFRGLPFPQLERLLERTRYVTRLTAICNRCGREATRSQRILAGQPAPATAPTILVGGCEVYEARCATCHRVT